MPTTRAQMFPLVENPHYEETYDTFDDIREGAEGLSVGLNQIQSWFIYDENDEEWGHTFDGEPDVRTFSLCVLMPRKSRFAVWTTHFFDRSEVDAWIESWVFPHVRAWYGMPT